MTTKYQRPAGAYAGASGLANRSKYNDDATAVPKRAISSAKVDGDINYLVDALNGIDEASGVLGSVAERLNVSLNMDGSLKGSIAAVLDDWVPHGSCGNLARVNDTTFSMDGGDYTALYKVNRRVRLMVDGAALVGDVAACSYASPLTSVTVANLVDADGDAAAISVAPAGVGYGPLVPGAAGNAPRRSERMNVVAGSVSYVFAGDGGDLVVLRDGIEVARIDDGGVSGLADGSVETSTLNGSLMATLAPAGMVVPFAGSSAPSGWLFCAGQAVSRTTYAGLFTAIGTAFGSGDGSTTFNLPDLRGRGVFGVDNMGGSAANRVTAGSSGIAGTTLGAGGGDERMHQHSHSVTDPGHTHGPSAGTGFVYSDTGGQRGGSGDTNGISDYGSTASAATGISIQNAGGGSSQNMPPALMLNYVIKT